MGCCSSSEKVGERSSEAVPLERVVEQHVSIERDLKCSRRDLRDTVKLLFLGSGESGKSTVLKQLRILHGAPFTEEELRLYGVVVRANVVTAVRKLCHHLRQLGLEKELDIESERAMNGDKMTVREAYDEVMAHIIEETAPPKEPDASGDEDWVGQSPRAGLVANKEAREFLAHHLAIDTLWKSQTMKQVWAKRAAVNVNDTHIAFLNSIPRLASPSYCPTDQDILNCRVRTTDIIVHTYDIDGTRFEMYDVGGQRSERRKWISCFDHVDAVVFVAALSEYDQTLSEQRYTNRMVEAIELFRSVCSNPAFQKSTILLFLNKKDIFAHKIMYSDINAQRPFADFHGPNKDFNAGLEYFTNKFQETIIDDTFHQSFVHVTCATDTNSSEFPNTLYLLFKFYSFTTTQYTVQFVLEATQMIIIQENLKRAGLLPT